MSEIRELAIRFLRESGSVGELRGGAFIHADELDYIVRASMREAYMRAATIADGQPVGNRIAAAIRAEADKLEGK